MQGKKERKLTDLWDRNLIKIRGGGGGGHYVLQTKTVYNTV